MVDDEVRAHEATFKADREQYLLTTHGAHVLDGLRFLLGDPVDLSAPLSPRAGNDLALARRRRPAGPAGSPTFEIAANVHGEWAEGADIYGERGIRAGCARTSRSR